MKSRQRYGNCPRTSGGKWPVGCLWISSAALRQTEAHNSGENGTPAAPLPDYTARRQRIFGDKVLPNMVLVARGREPW